MSAECGVRSAGLETRGRLPLFARFSELAERIAWLPLGDFPTRAHRLESLGRALGFGNLWIKRDDASGALGGGNKARKLEFLLADAKAKGCRGIALVAPINSNFALAASRYGQRCGFRVRAKLFPEGAAEENARKLEMHRDLGTEVKLLPSRLLLPFAFGVEWLHSRPRNPQSAIRNYLMPPGGTSALSALAYVNAAWELREQVGRGEMPEPDYIFLALGTGGTMAGLEVGLRSAGMKSQLIGVRVVPRIVANRWRIGGLARKTERLLGHTSRSTFRVSGSAFHPLPLILHGFYGAGYGIPTSEAAEAVRLMRELEGIELETTYTGKVLAGLARYMRDNDLQGRTILFWNTYGPIRV